MNRAFSTYLFFRLTQFQTHAALSPFQWLACTFLKYPTVPLHPSLNLPQLSLAADDATLITELLPPLPSSPPAPASHNELFSHSGWTGQKWQESCEEWDGKRKKRERERGRPRGGGGGEDGWNRGIQEERKLEGGRVQQREWCKVVGNQGRRKCEAGVWTEWRGKETWETEDKETVQLVRWRSYISQLESEEDIRGWLLFKLVSVCILLHIFIFLLSRQ